MATATAATAAASPRRLAVYLRSDYDNNTLRTHFSREGYRIVDETELPDAYNAFTYTICRGKINESYIIKAIDNADIIFFIYDTEITDVLGFVTVNFNEEKNNLYIAVVCASGRKRGVGLPLMNAVSKVAPVFGADHIILEALSEKDLTEFYKKRGYKFTAKRRGGLLPMEKNLTGTRVYDEALTYESLLESENVAAAAKKRASKEKEDADEVAHSLNLGLFVLPGADDKALRGLSKLKGVHVGYSHDYATIHDKKVAEKHIYNIIKKRADEDGYDVRDKDSLKRKIDSELWTNDFILYDYDSDPGKPKSFAFLSKKGTDFYIPVIYLEQTKRNRTLHLRELEFLQALNASMKILSPIQLLKFEVGALFGMEGYLDPPYHTNEIKNSNGRTYHVYRHGGRRTRRAKRDLEYATL